MTEDSDSQGSSAISIRMGQSIRFESLQTAFAALLHK